MEHHKRTLCISVNKATFDKFEFSKMELGEIVMESIYTQIDVVDYRVITETAEQIDYLIQCLGIEDAEDADVDDYLILTFTVTPETATYMGISAHEIDVVDVRKRMVRKRLQNMLDNLEKDYADEKYREWFTA